MPRRSTCPPERPRRPLLLTALLAGAAGACSQSPAPPREAATQPEPPALLDSAALLATLTTSPLRCTLRSENQVGEALTHAETSESLRVELDVATADFSRYRLAVGELAAWIEFRNESWSVRAGDTDAALQVAQNPADAPPGTRCAIARIETAAPDTAPTDGARAVLASWSAATTHELAFCEHTGLPRWTLEQRLGEHGRRVLTAECVPGAAP